jgi:ABC-type branched-subunit amino acid transport system ATPase component/MFS family permease
VPKPSRRRVLGLTLVNASTTLPLVTFALLLPTVAAERGWSSGALGGALVAGLLATALLALPLSDRAPLRRRGRAIALLAFNAAVLALLIALLPPLWLIVVLCVVRGVLIAALSSSSRSLAYDAVIPEARARAIARINGGHLIGAALGALIALLAIEGPALGSGQALLLSGVFAILLSLAAPLISDPEIGGVEPARLGRVLGRVDDPLTGLRPRWRDGYARVSRIPSVRRSLSAYVGVGWGSGLLILVPLVGLGEARDYPVRSIPIAVAVATLVAFVVLLLASRGIEKSRRRGTDVATRLIGLGLILSAVGLLALGVVRASVSPQLALALAGAFIAWVALDLTTFSVVQPEDRPTLGGLTTFSIVSGGLLALAVVTVIRGLGDTDIVGAGVLLAALPVFAFASAGKRLVLPSGNDLDARLGVDQDAQEFAAEEGLTASGVAGSPSIPTGPTALAAKNLQFSYGSVQVLFDVDLRVGEGEMVALLGPNGVGKTTTLRVLSGLEKPQQGSVRLGGVDVTSVPPSKRVAMGVSQIVGGNAVFGSMTVAENLQTYGFSMGRDRKAISDGIDEAFEMFPRLADRRNQLGSTLSGGEQQMLGLSKALISKPKVLIVDEFSLGLAPIIVGELLGMVRTLNARGTAILIVEQSVNVALNLVDRCYFMEKGRIVYEGRSSDLLAQPELVQALSLGGHAS